MFETFWSAFARDWTLSAIQLPALEAGKAAFLIATFGEGGLTNMGDHPADELVGRHASTAITGNAAQPLRHRAQQATPAAEHLGHTPANLSPYLKTLCPHKWIKNVLVFLPVLAAQQMLGATILQALLAFVSFSTIAFDLPPAGSSVITRVRR